MSDNFTNDIDILVTNKPEGDKYKVERKLNF